METKRADIIRLLCSYADALGRIEDFMTLVIPQPDYDLGGRIAYIRIETWMPNCVQDDEAAEELSSLYEQREEEAYLNLLMQCYSEAAWDDAKKMAQALDGELLTVHWIETGDEYIQRTATLILLDKYQAHSR